MKQKLVAIIALMVLTLPSGVMAAGTPAGTTITNTATASYSVGTASYEKTSEPVSTMVAELLDVLAISQNSSPVPVSPEAVDQALTFLVTNTGNGTDTYTFTGNSIISGDDFDPIYLNIYYDSNNNNIFDSGDSLINNTTGLSLDADENELIFVLNNIPSSLTDGQTGLSELTITSQTVTGSKVPGTVYTNMGDDSTDAIVGGSGAESSASGEYRISNVNLTITKTQIVTNDYNNAEPIPGATITYTVVVDVTGTGTAADVTVNDDIPADTTYTTGSTSLNGAPLSDPACTVTSTNPNGDIVVNSISVNLGDLVEASDAQTISFSVTID